MNILGKWVIVRGVDSGVNYGILEEFQGRCVLLKRCRNIWDWNGANTLKELAKDGPSSGNISVEVEITLINDVCQIEFPTEKALAKLSSIKWG